MVTARSGLGPGILPRSDVNREGWRPKQGSLQLEPQQMQGEPNRPLFGGQSSTWPSGLSQLGHSWGAGQKSLDRAPSCGAAGDWMSVPVSLGVSVLPP